MRKPITTSASTCCKYNSFATIALAENRTEPSPARPNPNQKFLLSVNTQTNSADRRPTRRNNPTKVTDQAIIAIGKNTEGINSRNGRSIAVAKRHVQAAYIPKGNTAPQYKGS